MPWPTELIDAVVMSILVPRAGSDGSSFAARFSAYTPSPLDVIAPTLLTEIAPSPKFCTKMPLVLPAMTPVVATMTSPVLVFTALIASSAPVIDETKSSKN